MTQPYIVVTDFRRGIDRRRSVFAGEPGALWDAKNVHITPGGDIEKRLGMVRAISNDLPEGTFGLLWLNGELWTFGSEDLSSEFPIGGSDIIINYQRLQAGSSRMTRLLSACTYAGKIYAIAEFEDVGIVHFYDGVRVTDWDLIAAPVTSNSEIIQKLRDLINESGIGTASVSGSNLYVTMPDYADHKAEAGVEHIGAPTNGNLQVTSKSVPVEPVTGAEAVGIITFVSRGSSGAREMQKIEVETDTLTDLLNYAVDGAVVWNSGVTPEDFAELVKDRINANTNSGAAHGWTATRVGASVWFSPPAGTYEGGNGIKCYYTKANISIAQPKAPAVGYTTQGGQNPVTGVNQVITFAISGTENFDAEYWVSIDGVRFAVRPYDLDPASFAVVHRSKVYAPTASHLYFCAIGNPRKWLSGVGRGYIDIVNQAIGSEPIVALAPFQGNLAVFQRTGAQIWSLPEDEEQAALLRSISSVGCVGNRAVLDVGGVDTFFVSRHGIRSLRARSLTDAPFVADVGSPIDKLFLQNLTDGTIEPGDLGDAIVTMNPRDGRIWVIVGKDRYRHIVYVLGVYPEAKVSAWTTYQFNFAPLWVATGDGRLFARDERMIYEYGGPNGQIMADDGGSTVYLARTPYYSFGTPGSARGEMGITLLSENTWGVKVYYGHGTPYSGAVYLGETRPADFNTLPCRIPLYANSIAFEFSAAESSHPGSISQVILHANKGPIF